MPKRSFVQPLTRVQTSTPGGPPLGIRIMAFDFGLKRIGIAVGNTATATTQALTTLRAGNGVIATAHLEKLLATWQPQHLVVGLPLHLNGRCGDMATRAQHFGERLAAQCSLPVAYIDERLSSHAADILLREATPAGKAWRQKRAARDSLAAELILRTYFDQHRV